MDSSRSSLPKWRRFRELSFRELRWVGLAWVSLPFVRMLIRLRGFQKTVRWLDDPDAANPRLSDDEVEKLARAVRTAASNHFMTLNCLPQSLWICNRLSRFGVPHVLRIGVTSLAANQLQAHAWVEAAGRKLNEPEAPEKQATPFEPAPASEGAPQ